ncbi:MAG: universal stress protein, partial [Actinomycetota bacterium]|nr:universal stress protein [Actinomycetota bacterium]
AAERDAATVWHAIVEAADELDARVVVLGSRGLSGVRSALLGSVSYGVVHHSRRPLLVVPPAG